MYFFLIFNKVFLLKWIWLFPHFSLFNVKDISTFLFNLSRVCKIKKGSSLNWFLLLNNVHLFVLAICGLSSWRVSYKTFTHFNTLVASQILEVESTSSPSPSLRSWLQLVDSTLWQAFGVGYHLGIKSFLYLTGLGSYQRSLLLY